MAMDSGSERRDTVAAVIVAELDRQGGDAAQGVDVDALADAIDDALNAPAPADEGKHPDELNATNDD